MDMLNLEKKLSGMKKISKKDQMRETAIMIAEDYRRTCTLNSLSHDHVVRKEAEEALAFINSLYCSKVKKMKTRALKKYLKKNFKKLTN